MGGGKTIHILRERLRPKNMANTINMLTLSKASNRGINTIIELVQVRKKNLVLLMQLQVMMRKSLSSSHTEIADHILEHMMPL